VVGALAGMLGGAALAPGGSAGANGRRGLCRPALVGCTRHSQCCGGICQVGRQLPRSRRNRCACDAGLVQCGDACVDLAIDAANCGACGEVCSGDDTCVSGVCKPAFDCSIYDGSLVPSGMSWCIQTIEGGGAVSYPCVHSDSTPCTSSDDCADKATAPGEVAVCATGSVMCFGSKCNAPYPYPGAICSVIQTLACI